jgi:hypothetical protein
MIAAIGTGGIPRPNRRLTSDAPRLPVTNLPQLGQTIVLAWKTPAGALHARVTRTAEGLVIETGGTSVLVGLREWPMPLGRGTRTRFTCSNCGALRDILHWRGVWGCRAKDCLDLEHSCRHEQRWCPAIRRRAKLLRKLARVSPQSLRGRWLREQIARQQAAMLANLKRVNRDLTKRSRRHGRRRRASSG